MSKSTKAGKPASKTPTAAAVITPPQSIYVQNNDQRPLQIRTTESSRITTVKNKK